MWESGLELSTSFFNMSIIFYIMFIFMALGISIKIKHIMNVLVIQLPHNGMGYYAAPMVLINHILLSLSCALFLFFAKAKMKYCFWQEIFIVSAKITLGRQQFK